MPLHRCTWNSARRSQIFCGCRTQRCHTVSGLASFTSLQGYNTPLVPFQCYLQLTD